MKEFIMTKAIKNKYYQRDNTERLNKDELLFFRNKLEEKKEKIQKSLETKITELNVNIKDDPKDEADHAMLAIESTINNAILHEQHKTLNEINRSLNRITLGNYGICQLCEETINIERLKVKIFSEYCISCKEILEKRR